MTVVWVRQDDDFWPQNVGWVGGNSTGRDTRVSVTGPPRAVCTVQDNRHVSYVNPQRRPQVLCYCVVLAKSTHVSHLEAHRFYFHSLTGLARVLLCTHNIDGKIHGWGKTQPYETAICARTGEQWRLVFNNTWRVYLFRPIFYCFPQTHLKVSHFLTLQNKTHH